VYRFMDRNLDDFDEATRFIIRSTRGWIRAVVSRKCPAQAIAQEFLSHNLIAGMGPFHRVLMALNMNMRLPLAYAGHDCPRVAEGESLILTLIADEAIAEPALDALIDRPCAVSAVMESLNELRAALHIAGLCPQSGSRDA